MDDRRAAEGFEHLQTAAHELIAAARVFLDAMEDLVDEPEWMSNSVSSVVDLVKDVAGARTQPWERHAWARDNGNGNGSNPDPVDPFDSVLDDQAVVDLTDQPGAVDENAEPIGNKKPAPVANRRGTNGAEPGRRRASASSKVKRISVD